MRRVVALLVSLLATMTAVADTVVLQDGTTMTGRVVRELPQAVMFETTSVGVKIVREIPRDRISSLVPTAKASGPAFLKVPLEGTVGIQITAAAIDESFATARQLGATDVVFLFDSPGGDVVEMNRIIDVMAHNADLRTIAFIKDANSAAALIAGACRTIVMYPEGRCGAAVPFVADQHGMPAAVTEKLTSAVCAIARNAAALGGRSPDLFIAMIDPHTELWATEPVDAGSPTVITPTKPDKGCTCIKPKGKVLTLTSDEAVRYGLAVGTARSMKDVAQILRITSWTDCGDDAWEIMRRHAADREAELAQQRDRNGQQQVHATQKMQQAATAVALEQRIHDTQASLAAYHKQLAGLDSQLDAQLKKLDSDTTAALAAVGDGEGSTVKRVLLRERHEMDVRQARANADALRSQLTDNIAIMQQRLRDDQKRIKELQQ